MHSKGLDYVTSESFLADVKQYTEKWDKEWIRYFFLHDDNNYFKTYAGRAYGLALSPEQISAFSNYDSLTRNIDQEKAHTKLQIYLAGHYFVNKDVFEIGCGVGMLGRIMGKFCRSYTGYDYSPLALHIARLVSPKQCRYIYAGDPETVLLLNNSADLCFGRHFFIHNNFDNSTWVLKFLRDVVRDNGIIHADFFRAERASERIFPAKSPLLENVASCGFFYTDDNIEELAELCELRILSIDRVDKPPRVYVNFKKR
jgi:SAM-dependent methyltransferase